MQRSLIVLAFLAGCGPSLGPRDEDAALEVVYDREGTPLFAGQALAVASCGGGGFCHADSVGTPADRFGAPHGLGFDVRIASTSVDVQFEATERLLRNQLNVLANRGSAWAQVRGGHMPPRGAAGDAYHTRIAPQFYEGEELAFTRFDAAGEPVGPLPAIDTEEGREIFRNWLAAGVPVVERTQNRIDRQPNATGFTVASCERTCVDPTWESIYQQIIRTSCALSSCHGFDEPGSELVLEADLTPAGASEQLPREEYETRLRAALERLLDAQPTEAECALAGHELVVPGDGAVSLLYRKVAPAPQFPTTTSCTSAEDCAGVEVPAECLDPDPERGWQCVANVCTYECEVCGTSMPASGNALTEQRLCAIREWIQCGACGPGDASCDACIATARETCGVGAPFDPALGFAECAEPEPCPNRP